MYRTTGFTKAEITGLCARIEARELSPRIRRWPPILGLCNALTVTLTYLRRNRVQAEIAENYGVSQPTISRAISAITPLLVQALLDYVPTADELDVGRCYIVDGTLLPCWSWRAHPVVQAAPMPAALVMARNVVETLLPWHRYGPQRPFGPGRRTLPSNVAGANVQRSFRN